MAIPKMNRWWILPAGVLVFATAGCGGDAGSDGDSAASADAGDVSGGAGDADSTTLADADTPEDGSMGGEDSDAADGTGDIGEPVASCPVDGLPKQALLPTTSSYARGETAAPFELAQADGEIFRFLDVWDGCESLVFLPDTLTVSQLDFTSLWEADLESLVQSSPLNTHYFFVSRLSGSAAQAQVQAMQGRVDALLAGMVEVDAAHWQAHLHVGALPAGKLPNWLNAGFATYGQGGFAIDRAQRIRGLGSFADVYRPDAALQQAGAFPWRDNLAYAAKEAHYFNAQAAQREKLKAENVTEIWLWTGEVLEQFEETVVELPSAEEMAKFDTLELLVDLACPNEKAPELGNCGAWDYLAHLFVDPDGEGYREVGRFITSYHRETFWVVDATPALAWLRAGGSFPMKWEFAPEWNKQPTGTRLSLRFSNRGKGFRPMNIEPLWSGGNFNSEYNTLHQIQTIPIDSNAAHVEVWTLVTGHGAETNQCAEFCNHVHEITVNGSMFRRDHPQAGNLGGCIDEIERGMVPNQAGTWWFGRGGWCPGQQVEPWVIDVTDLVTPGADATLSYQGLYAGKTPPDGAGNIVFTSYLVTYAE